MTRIKHRGYSIYWYPTDDVIMNMGQLSIYTTREKLDKALEIGVNADYEIEEFDEVNIIYKDDISNNILNEIYIVHFSTHLDDIYPKIIGVYTSKSDAKIIKKIYEKNENEDIEISVSFLNKPMENYLEDITKAKIKYDLELIDLEKKEKVENKNFSKTIDEFLSYEHNNDPYFGYRGMYSNKYIKEVIEKNNNK
jgi:hypothetical protein